MASAVQAQAESQQSDQRSPENSRAKDVHHPPARLLAHLRTQPGGFLTHKLPLSVTQKTASGLGGLEEAESFLVATKGKQRDDGLTVAVIGEPRIVAEDEASGLLGIDADKLLELYESEGKSVLGKLHGSWAIVIIDPRQERMILACDRLGRQPLYFRINDDTVMVSDSLSELRGMSGTDGLDSQALYHYLYFHMIPAPESVRSGFHKLASASVLEIGPEGRQLTRYWSPAFTETPPGSLSAAHEALKLHLKTAVKRCVAQDQNSHGDAVHGGVEQARVAQKVGAFLSGGLDSSTVAGMLGEVQGGSCDAYAIGFEAEGYDEMPYARLAAEHFGIRLHEHYVTPDEVVAALPEIAAAAEEPFGNSSVLPAYFCARMAAADGVDVLLAGDGGDELFAGNERYVSQRIFENYRRIPGWLRAGFIEPLVRLLPHGFPLVSKGRSFLRQANTLLPDRLQYYSFLEQINPAEVFSTQFLQWVDQARPLKLLNEIYHTPDGASTLNRMLYLDWQITLADNDLRKVSHACALAGVEVRYPMLDDDLVEFSTRLPSAWKLPGNSARSSKLRHFYKQALRGWLPDETISKSKHGFGLPFGVWMKTHKPLQEMAYDNILRLKDRGIFRPAFLDQAIASHREGHAAYFGELVWVLTCLELWLAANEPGYHLEQEA